nr:DUF6285 domain-containing protein [Polymorphobacter sp.]
MAGHPSARDLVAAVREFIAGLGLEGRDAFHAKVAANALAIVERELEQVPDAAEVAALASLHRGEGGEAADLRSAICTALRSGTLTTTTPGLLDALTAANLARLAVDNPRYSTFLRRSADALPQR